MYIFSLDFERFVVGGVLNIRKRMHIRILY